MKKVLLATTVLALSAGVASAEITMSGSARLGLTYTGDIAGSAAVAGAWVAADYASTGAATKAATASALYLNSAFSAPTAAGASTQTQLTKLNETRAEIVRLQGLQAAGQLANVSTGITSPAVRTAAQLASDLADVDAAIAAASGTAAVADQNSVVNLNNRITVNVDASTETSSGLTFGGRLRIRSSNGNNATVNGARVYMKSGAVEVAVGNIYGALDSMPGMYDSEVGLTALSDAGVVAAPVTNGWGYDGYSSTGSQMGAEVIYSAGAFTGHLSVTDADAGSATNRVAAVGAYTMGDWTVALGVQDSTVNTEDKTVLTIGGKVGDFHVGFAAADNDGISKIALNGSATFGATTVNGFVADDESGTDTAFGLGVSHDIGGASVIAGIERDAVGVTRADMGVSFSF